MNGKMALQDRFAQKNQNTLDVSTLPKGVYLIKAETPEGNTSKKIVIR
jgi:hypothetical protein